MKKSLFLLCTGLLFLLLYSCRKDKKDQPDNPGGNYTTIDVQVILPAGTSVDLTKTKILSLSNLSSVGADGKASIAYNNDTWEVAYLFDESKSLLMAGFISNENREISIASTAQVMLYYGLGVTYAGTNGERITSLKEIPAYSQFPSLKAKLEELFISDPTMLGKEGYLGNYIKTVNAITNVPVIDVKGKQIKVEDADKTKSGMTVNPQSGNDESIEVNNTYLRRGHAYFYKMRYKDDKNMLFTIYPEISNVTPPKHELPILGKAVSGPQGLPLESHESEATWKVRVIGVGGDATLSSSLNLTSQEAAKLEEMWIEFFAADLLLPLLLDNLNQKTTAQDLILPNNIDKVRPFINEIKALMPQSTLSFIKDGEYVEGLRDFQANVLWDSHKLASLEKKLLEGIQGLGPQQYIQAESTVEAIIEYQTKAQEFTTQVITGQKAANPAEVAERLDYINSLFDVIHENCNTLEEWTVKSRNNDVTINPRNSQAMTFTNHILSVTSNPELAPGETVEYKWTTTGQYGSFKDGTQKVTTFTGPKATYYSEVAPNENNIETVYVTAYIKSANGTREFGDDTGTINVKKIKIVMTPNGATLTPKLGSKALTLRLLNSDGTNPIINSSAVQYKVEWSTPGNYGHLDNNTKTYTTPKNTVIYTATDEDVKSASESITARVYFKLASTDWMFREEVKGSVIINNDPKKIIYYSSLSSYHHDRNDGGGNLWHYTNCGVAIKPVEDALSYSVQITLPGTNPSTYSETWSASAPGWLRGYMYGIDPATTGTHYVGYGASWGSCANGNCEHTVASCGRGEAKVTITLK